MDKLNELLELVNKQKRLVKQREQHGLTGVPKPYWDELVRMIEQLSPIKTEQVEEEDFWAGY